MRKIKTLHELVDLMIKKKSVVWGEHKHRCPAAVFVNMQAIFVYNMLREGQVFLYEPKPKRLGGKVAAE